MSLVIVDTSIWIDTFSSRGKSFLDPARLNEVATCLPIVQEVLQGVRHDGDYETVKQAFLAFPCFEPQMGQDLFLAGSDLYRAARKRGLTVRSSVDCLIAAVCIKHKIAIFHKDRDFTLMARFSDLQIAEW